MTWSGTQTRYVLIHPQMKPKFHVSLNTKLETVFRLILVLNELQCWNWTPGSKQPFCIMRRWNLIDPQFVFGNRSPVSSAPWISLYQLQIKFAVIKCWCRRKVRIGCCADCFPLPVCQIVISKKLLSVLHPLLAPPDAQYCMSIGLSVCLSAAPHSVWPSRAESSRTE